MQSAVLVQQPSKRTNRKVQAATGAGGLAAAMAPLLVAWGYTAITGADLSPACAAEIGNAAAASVVVGSGIIGGAATWAAGYFARERANDQ